MQKLGLTQSLSQKLSPQQIQFIKLLQVPTAELETRIEEELEINPALEEGKEEEPKEVDDFDDIDNSASDELNIDEYLPDDDYA
ncbi:MAG: RNA polymerase sigma-54 factor, partial [Imperialibacter sp.]